VTESCNCTTNLNEHLHRMLRPQQVAPLIGRPFNTVDSWRKSGKLPSTGSGYGRVRVCICCAATLAITTEQRWVERAGRALGRTIRADVA